MIKKYLYGLLAVCCSVGLSTIAKQASMKCNGSEKLCERRYNQVSYPGAHNRATTPAFEFINISNQDQTVKQMLHQGIRFMKLPIHPQEGKNYICHGVESVKGIEEACAQYLKSLSKDLREFSQGVCDSIAQNMGKKPCMVDKSKVDLPTFIQTLKDFLDANPHEIITLVIEDFTKDYKGINGAFKPLYPYMRIQNTKKAWPTLANMIASNQRLVVFVDRDWGPQDKTGSHFNRKSAFIFEDDWEYKKVSDLMTNITIIDRGKSNYNARNNPPKNKLWLMWNMVTPLVGGSLQAAKQANKESLLKGRLARFKKKYKTGNPNFVAVDFFEHPKQNGLFAFVNWLNNQAT